MASLGAPAGLTVLAQILEASSEAIFRIDADGAIVEWNRAAERLYGWPAIEVVGRSLATVPFGPTHDLLDHAVQRALAGERVELVEAEVVRRDGLPAVVSLTTTPVVDGLGAPGVLVIGRDETERRVAQETLAESEARLREAQSLAHAGLWIWDVAADAVQWSEELYKIHGVDPFDFDGTLDAHLAPVHERYRDDVRAAMQRAIADRHSFEEEYPIICPSGELRWVSVRGEPASGSVDGMRGICQDITERKRGEQALQRHAQLLELVNRVAVAANEERTLEGVLRRCVREVCEHAGWALGHVYLVSEVGDSLRSAGLWHSDDGSHFTAFRRATEASRLFSADDLAATVFHTATPLWLEDVAGQLSPDRAAAAASSGLRSGCAFPVLAGHEVVAVLEFFSPDEGRRDERLLEVLAGCGTQVGRVVERARAAAALTKQALQDPLTGLPNRALFVDRTGQAVTRLARQGTSGVAVLFLDLDGFKDINDSLGHAVGDDVLVAIAGRLQRVLRQTDTVARFGGDEFTVLCEGFTSEEEVLEVAERIAAVVADPLELEGARGLVITPSIGITFASETSTTEALLRDADAAMYRAKQEGRARYQVFNSAIHQRAAKRLEITNALRRAVEQNELRLVYQPQYDLADGRMVGVEALVRWVHPQRGLIMPDEFIPVAEESHLIVPLGAWVIDEACRQLARWREEGVAQHPFEMCVNVSARQLARPDLLQQLPQVIAANGLSPADLCLEITETQLMGDADFFLEALVGLKALGVKLAIDDFGTGYSSLAYLRRFPIDVLKIDKTFVDDLNGVDGHAAAIVGLAVDIAHVLGLVSVAEGVETDAQCEDLKRLGCDLAQGYLFARPESADTIASLLRE